MRPEDIDRIFRESADSAQFEFDPQEWQKAKALLPKKKKRRWLPLLLFGLGLGLGTLLILVYPYSQQNDGSESLQSYSSSITADDVSDIKTAYIDRPETHTPQLKKENTPLSQNAGDNASNTFNTTIKSKTKVVTTHQDLGKRQENYTSTSSQLRMAWSSSQLPLSYSEVKWKPLIDRPIGLDKEVPSTFKKWELGLSIAAAYHHLEGGSNGGGASMGIMLRKNLKSGVYFELAPRFTLSTGFDNVTNREIQRIYGLESHDNIYGLQLRQLVHLNIPLRLGIHLKSWRFGLGPSLGYLVEGYGDLVELSAPDDDFKIVNTLASGRFDKMEISKFYLGLSANINYRLSRLSEIGIETTRMPHQFFTDTYEPLKDKKSWLVSFTYNYYID